MTLIFKHGDLFTQPVEALVNTVNCVGVMGKGVALEFKRRWPENFKSYKLACDTKRLRPGVMHIFDTQQLFTQTGPRYLINFPTKAHWRSRSKLEYIEEGLDALAQNIRDLGIASIAMPPLGCGNGGLEWRDVKPLIVEKLGVLDDVEIIVLEPQNSVDAPEYTPSEFSMTYPRAMLLKSLAELEVYFDGEFDRVSLHKIAYFLQALGVEFNLQYKRGLYGPFSDKLKNAFISFEKSDVLSGFTKRESRTHVTPVGVAMADEFLHNQNQPTDEIIQKLSNLVQGYESPFGLEILSTVHWLAKAEHIRSADEIIEAVHTWDDRKRDNFDAITIRGAYNRLYEDGLIS